MSVYRPHSELFEINRRAPYDAVEVEPRLFELLLHTRRLSEETGGAFDPTSGPLVALWRKCRADGRIPTPQEIDACLERTGVEHVIFDKENRTVRFDREGIELNLNAIGKGYALDRAGALLGERGLNDWLLHGGHSSILGRGDHNQTGGWPVGVRDPLFPQEQLATILLPDAAIGSSGSGTQHFRHAGKRYGHILDPRTGWPVEDILSVTVVAPTAAEADALSTAIFVMGVEKACEFCNNHPRIGALLIPPPRRGRTLEPLVFGIPDELLFFSSR
jgi:thiamine biosynthesis lipoprotein